MPPSPGYGGALVQTLLALVAVCALAALVLRLLRRRYAPPASALRVVSRLGLEPRRTLYIVEAAGKLLLVGVGDGPMTVLAELSRNQLTAALLTPPSIDEPIALAESLRRLMGGRSS